MDFYISYFAQFRNMTSKQICFSTAVWDPKWFHDFKDSNHKFVKDGKIYGLRMPCFICNDTSCSGMPCPHLPSSCRFLKAYKQHLDELDFKKIVNALKKSANIVAKELGVKDPDVVLLVHEAPTNRCSERQPLVKWFEENGMTLQEWHK